MQQWQQLGYSAMKSRHTHSHQTRSIIGLATVNFSYLTPLWEQVLNPLNPHDASSIILPLLIMTFLLNKLYNTSTNHVISAKHIGYLKAHSLKSVPTLWIYDLFSYVLEQLFLRNCFNNNNIYFSHLPPTSSHLYSSQVENCGRNSRLVVDEDDNCKLRFDGWGLPILSIWKIKFIWSYINYWSQIKYKNVRKTMLKHWKRRNKLYFQDVLWQRRQIDHIGVTIMRATVKPNNGYPQIHDPIVYCHVNKFVYSIPHYIDSKYWPSQAAWSKKPHSYIISCRP